MEIQTVPLDTADSACQDPQYPLRAIQVGQMGDQPAQDDADHTKHKETGASRGMGQEQAPDCYYGREFTPRAD